jgi:hypothetical protein
VMEGSGWIWLLCYRAWELWDGSGSDEIRASTSVVAGAGGRYLGTRERLGKVR